MIFCKIRFMNYRDIIKSALKEDIKSGDITTRVFVDREGLFKGKMVSKEDGIVCGVDFAKMVFEILNPQAKVSVFKKDGDSIKKSSLIMEIISDRSVFTGERTALNIVQKLSGISTITSRFVKIASRYGVDIYDTRKTTPNFRIMEKYAVSKGGGKNHRYGLFDAFMIKDNHLSVISFDEIKEKLKLARKKYPQKEIEIEVQSLKQLNRVIAFDVDVIMLDNMSVSEMRKAIKKIRILRPDVEIEISGGVNEKTIETLSSLMPDRISIGMITHSTRWLDISLDIERIK